MCLTIKRLLLAMAASISVGSMFSHAEGVATPEIVFIDPPTGLTWTRCLIGTRVVTSITNEEVPKVVEQCAGDEINVDWFAATNIARESVIDGKKGWRLPTQKELDDFLNRRAISKTEGQKLFPFLYGGADASLWVWDKDPFSLTPIVADLLTPLVDSGNTRAVFKNRITQNGKNPFVLVLDKEGATRDSTKRSYYIKELRFFKDSATGLTWVPSLIEADSKRVYNDETKVFTRVKSDQPCQPKEEACYSDIQIQLNWWESISVVNDLELGGVTGWRLPTRADLETILPKLSTPGYPRAYEFLDLCRTADAGRKAGSVVLYSRSQGGFIETPAVDVYSVCVVRGPTPGATFSKLVDRAMKWNGDEN